jgi:hypothetical protein
MPPGITSMLTASSSRVPGLACRWGIGTRVQCVGWQGGLLCQPGGVAAQPRSGGHAEAAVAGAASVWWVLQHPPGALERPLG